MNSPVHHIPLESNEQDTLTFGMLSSVLQPYVITFVLTWIFLIIGSSSYLIYKGSQYAYPYIIAAFSTIIPIWVWRNSLKKGAPYMVLHVIIQGIFLIMPMAVSNQKLEEYSSEVILLGSIAVFLYFISIAIGWKLSTLNPKDIPSKWLIVSGHSNTVNLLAMRIAIFLLFIGLIGQLIIFFFYLGSLWPVIRSLCGASASLGALLGGYADGNARRFTIKFWGLLSLIFFLAIHDILISAANQFILAAILGFALGSRKIPWKLLIVIFTLISFLNLGKFVMRNRYWGTHKSNTTGVSLMGLPSLYTEWFDASFTELMGGTDPSIKMVEQIEKSKDGDFSQRINGFETPLFVTRAITQQEIPLLYGATYSLIPPLLLPRFLWPNKPRAHVSQDLLNIHFKRQREVDVERTFIAWGLLPEGIGNFGIWLGPVFIGLVLGSVTGRLESWSVAKALFSVEGFVALGLLLQALISYDICSSVFVTSTFQMVIVSFAGAFMIRSIFNRPIQAY
jgi:hypothetical protein